MGSTSRNSICLMLREMTFLAPPPPPGPWTSTPPSRRCSSRLSLPMASPGTRCSDNVRSFLDPLVLTLSHAVMQCNVRLIFVTIFTFNCQPVPLKSEDHHQSAHSCYRGVRETQKALDKRQALLCIL